MNISKKRTLFALIYFIEYMAMGLAYCMMISYLITLGYSATQRGTMVAFGAVIAFLTQFLIGYLCDKNKTIRRYVCLILILYAVIGTVLYCTDFYNFPVHLMLVGLNVMMLKVAMGITDSWVLESGSDCKDNFGFIRAFGSIGWAIGSMIAAKIIEYAGYHVLGYSIAGLMAVSCLVATRNEDAQKQSSEKISIKDIGILFQSKAYLLTLCIFFCLIMMQVTLDYAMVDKFSILGASSTQISLYWSLTAMCELPMLFLGGAVVKKFGNKSLLFVALIGYGIRYFLYGGCASILSMFMISLLQAITYPFLQLTSKYMVDAESPENLKSSGQQIGLAFYSQSSALIAPMLVGVIEDSMGVNMVFYIVGCCSILGLVFTYLYLQNKKKQAI